MADTQPPVLESAPVSAPPAPQPEGSEAPTSPNGEADGLVPFPSEFDPDAEFTETERRESLADEGEDELLVPTITEEDDVPELQNRDEEDEDPIAFRSLLQELAGGEGDGDGDGDGDGEVEMDVEANIEVEEEAMNVDGHDQAGQEAVANPALADEEEMGQVEKEKEQSPSPPSSQPRLPLSPFRPS